MNKVILGIVLIVLCSFAYSSPVPQDQVVLNNVASPVPVGQHGQILQITPYTYHGHHNANSHKVLQQQPQQVVHQPQTLVFQQPQAQVMGQTQTQMVVDQTKQVPALHHVPLDYYHQYIPQYQSQYQPIFQYYQNPFQHHVPQQYVLVPHVQQARSEIHDQMTPNKDQGPMMAKMSDDTVELRNENIDENPQDDEPTMIGDALEITNDDFDADDN